MLIVYFNGQLTTILQRTNSETIDEKKTPFQHPIPHECYIVKFFEGSLFC